MLSSESIQFLLLVMTSLFFALAFVLGVQHMRRAGRLTSDSSIAQPPYPILAHEASMGPPARVAVLVGTLLALGLYAWRTISERSLALPLSDPFDAFLVLGLLLAFVVIYFRWTRHLRSLSFFLLPMIVLVLLIGAVLALLHPATDRQDYRNVWTFVHVLTIVAGSVCFALGCVGGVVYLLADRQLRRKGLDATHRWIGLPPLASIEKFNRWMIYVGFPLLTIATVAGILRITQQHETPAAAPGFAEFFKIALGSLSWAVYAVLVYVPLNPRLRGPRAAWLSIAGFALFIGAFVAARWN